MCCLLLLLCCLVLILAGWIFASPVTLSTEMGGIEMRNRRDKQPQYLVLQVTVVVHIYILWESLLCSIFHRVIVAKLTLIHPVST